MRVACSALIYVLEINTSIVKRMSNYERAIINTYYNDARSESPYECRMKRGDETLTTGIMYLPRVLPNGTQGRYSATK
jgi:hypothetical protein